VEVYAFSITMPISLSLVPSINQFRQFHHSMKEHCLAITFRSDPVGINSKSLLICVGRSESVPVDRVILSGAMRLQRVILPLAVAIDKGLADPQHTKRAV
jgi:hypothetical protein